MVCPFNGDICFSHMLKTQYVIFLLLMKIAFFSWEKKLVWGIWIERNYAILKTRDITISKLQSKALQYKNICLHAPNH